MTPAAVVLAAHDPGGDRVSPFEVVQRRPVALLDLEQHGHQIGGELHDPA